MPSKRILKSSIEKTFCLSNIQPNINKTTAGGGGGDIIVVFDMQVFTLYKGKGCIHT